MNLFNLSRDIWLLLLRRLKFNSLHQLSTVSSAWLVMAREAVVSFDSVPKASLRGLTDDVLSRYPNIASLSLNVNYVGIRHLRVSNEGVKRCVNLTYLNINGNPNIIDYGIMDLTKLRYLYVQNNPSITNRGLRELASGLTYLDIGGASKERITNDVLIRFTNLLSLNLYENIDITNDGLHCFVDALFPQLKERSQNHRRWSLENGESCWPEFELERQCARRGDINFDESDIARSAIQQLDWRCSDSPDEFAMAFIARQSSD
jgi:hypothetical protein